MTVFDMYDAQLKNDANHELYQSLLSSAEGKLKGEGELSAFELCALLDGMAGFERGMFPLIIGFLTIGTQLMKIVSQQRICLNTCAMIPLISVLSMLPASSAV